MGKNERKEVVISLHPEWWERMKAGEKLLEIRKTRPQGKGPFTVMVYVTGGVGVVGEFVCDCFYEIPTKQYQSGRCRMMKKSRRTIWKRQVDRHGSSCSSTPGTRTSPCGAGISRSFLNTSTK